MGILTDRQIRELVQQKPLFIDEFDESFLQPATYDLLLHFNLHPTLSIHMGN